MARPSGDAAAEEAQASVVSTTSRTSPQRPPGAKLSLVNECGCTIMHSDTMQQQFHETHADKKTCENRALTHSHRQLCSRTPAAPLPNRGWRLPLTDEAFVGCRRR